MSNLTYPELVKQIMPLFIPREEIPVEHLHQLIDKAFKKFSRKTSKFYLCNGDLAVNFFFFIYSFQFQK